MKINKCLKVVIVSPFFNTVMQPSLVVFYLGLVISIFIILLTMYNERENGISLTLTEEISNSDLFVNSFVMVVCEHFF